MNYFYIFCINQIKKKKISLLPFWIISLFFVIIPIFIIIYYAFFLNSSSVSYEDKKEIFQPFIVISFIRSFIVAIITVITTILIGFPIATTLINYKSKLLKILLIFLINLPIWSNFFIKLIGLKSLFDFCFGEINSTYGIIYTLIGLVYIYTPFAILNLYNSLKNIKKNLILASQDLGSNNTETFFKVILPQTKTSLWTTIIIIFLPSLFSVTASEFFNNENSTKMIGEILNNILINSFDSEYSKTMISNLFIGISGITILIFLLFQFLIKLFSCFKKNM